jgi:hypothetical protein
MTRYFEWILIAFSSHPIYPTYVQLPDAQAPVPPKILSSVKFNPYFANVIGSMAHTLHATHWLQTVKLLVTARGT